MREPRENIVGELREYMLRLQGYVPEKGGMARIPGLLPVEAVFPNRVFPIHALHEFVGTRQPEWSATCGFLGGLLKHILQTDGVCVWAGRFRKIDPLALAGFGHSAERFLFVDALRENQVLWAMEEALKCPAVRVVVGEVQHIDFIQSRRLQLAAEKNQSTAFILNHNPQRSATSVCAARWKIVPLPSETENGMPGVGFPRWQVELLKVRNGETGSWEIGWQGDQFSARRPKVLRVHGISERKTG